jgi:hypothetical protein
MFDAESGYEAHENEVSFDDGIGISNQAEVPDFAGAPDGFDRQAVNIAAAKIIDRFPSSSFGDFQRQITG